MNKALKNRTLNRKSINVVLLLLLVFIILGAVFWVLNIDYEPKYGDTVEYWQLSKTLQVDSWRTLAYPLILRFFSSMPFVSPLIPLYIMQTVVSFLAAYYLFLTLDTVNENSPQQADGVFTLRENKRKMGRINSNALFLSLLLIIIPIINHFNLTVLTDSLAASLFVISIVAMARIFVLEEISKITLLIASINLCGSVFLRTERFVYFLVLCLFLLFWNIAVKSQKKVIISLFFVLIILGSNQINQLTQTSDLGRQKVSIAFALFERTAQGHFAELLPKMPSVMRNRISIDLAKLWDTDPNFSIVIGANLNDQAGKEAMIQGSIIALSNNFFDILKKSFIDFLEYLFAPLNYARESFWPKKDPTSWTNSRMDGNHPAFVAFYRNSSSFILGVILLISVFIIKNIFKSSAGLKSVFVFWSFCLILFSLFFASRTSLDSHIRYALPVYFLEFGVLFWISQQHLAKTISVVPEYLKLKPKK